MNKLRLKAFDSNPPTPAKPKRMQILRWDRVLAAYRVLAAHHFIAAYRGLTRLCSIFNKPAESFFLFVRRRRILESFLE